VYRGNFFPPKHFLILQTVVNRADWRLSGWCNRKSIPADPPWKLFYKTSFRIKLSLDIIFKRFNITEFATGRCFFRQKIFLVQQDQQPMSVQGGIVTHVLFTSTDIKIAPNFRD
jgi:hypothetical protein